MYYWPSGSSAGCHSGGNPAAVATTVGGAHAAAHGLFGGGSSHRRRGVRRRRRQQPPTRGSNLLLDDDDDNDVCRIIRHINENNTPPRSDWLIKIEFSEKHTKFEKIFPMASTNQLIYLVNAKTMRKIFSNRMCFSESPNFTCWTVKKYFDTGEKYSKLEKYFVEELIV